MTEEHKRKIGLTNSICLLGHKVSRQTRLKISNSHKGKKHSKETKQKISESEKGKIVSLKTRQLLSKINKGKKMSTMFKEKMKQIMIERWKNPEYKEKLFWTKLKNCNGVYRKLAFKMFGKICSRCKIINPKRFEVHHKDHNHYNNPLDGSNWRVLCSSCHVKIHWDERK